ncbi:MAG TPA: LexA family transcriptional regulator [Bacteroidia bacterium]|nr:LexA family transcriptional regulator [Bacteroidia bacterium]HNT80325.1 LexA family transcriptional regulator [Bacteroidia bacterium]
MNKIGDKIYLGNNLKLLRKRKQRTQDVVANELGMTRPTLNNYENGIVKNPTIQALILFSEYYKLSIDDLIKQDLSSTSESMLGQMERGFDAYLNGKKLRILATTVDQGNRDNIELVNAKASAGYRQGYADSEFVSSLPVFQLPILFSERKYRMFEISGDSMLPIPDGAYVIGEYVDDWTTIKSGTACVLLTRDDGIVFKIVDNHLKQNKTFVLSSLNTFYKPYEISGRDVLEVWKFCNYISRQLPHAPATEDHIMKALEKLQSDVKQIGKKL